MIILKMNMTQEISLSILCLLHMCNKQWIQIYQFTRRDGSEEDVQFLIFDFNVNYLELWKSILDYHDSFVLAWLFIWYILLTSTSRLL